LPTELGHPLSHYLEVCVDVETSTKRARATDEHTKDQDVDEAMWENAMSHTETDEAPPKPAKQARARPCGNDDTDDMISEHDKQAVRDLLLSVRKTHGSYDRASREGKQVLSASATHKNTKDSQIQRDLEVLLETAKSLDAAIIEFEVKSAEDPTAAHVAQIPDVVAKLENLAETMKQARKKMAGLRALWKM